MTWERLLVALGAGVFPLSFALAGCPAASDVATDPVWGKQPCAHCAMLVGDRASAAEAIDGRGERVFFDDVGCMIAWEGERAPLSRAWVRGPSATGWVSVDRASFAGGARTPMDFGFVAQENGALRYADVKRRVNERLAQQRGAPR